MQILRDFSEVSMVQKDQFSKIWKSKKTKPQVIPLLLKPWYLCIYKNKARFATVFWLKLKFFINIDVLAFLPWAYRSIFLWIYIKKIWKVWKNNWNFSQTYENLQKCQNAYIYSQKFFCLDFKKWYCIRGHNSFDYFDKSSGIRDIFNFIPMIGRAYFSFLRISFKR